MVTVRASTGACTVSPKARTMAGEAGKMGRKIPDGPSADMDTRKERLVVLAEQRIDDGAPRSKGGERVKISPSWRFETGRNVGCADPQKAVGRLGVRGRSRAVRHLTNCLAGAVPHREHPEGSHIAESIRNASGRRGGPYDLAAGHGRARENGRGAANSEPRGFPPELCRARPESACVRGSALGLQKRPGSQIRCLGGWE